MGSRVYTGFRAGGYNMPEANKQLGMLYVDFGKMEEMEGMINKAFEQMRIDKSKLISSAQMGEISMYDLDQQLADFIRVDIRKQLSAIRSIAMRKARSGMRGRDIGAASGAVLRRNYKDQLGGNINIASNKRMSSKTRPWSPGKILKRDHTKRTAQINRYYGPDRSFILRILDVGRDEYMAQSGTGAKGRGSKATWGRRGAIAARGFFHEMKPNMDRAAQQIGRDVEKFVGRLLG